MHDREAVADIVQDTFFRALRSLPSLQEPARFRPWLLSIARHLVTDQLRPAKAAVLDESATYQLADSRPGPGYFAELNELAEQVTGLCGRFVSVDATAIAMVTQLGFTPEQVARSLGLKAGAAKVLLHRAPPPHASRPGAAGAGAPTRPGLPASCRLW